DSRLPRPKFDVASVKECKATEQAPPSRTFASEVSLGCWSLRTIIQQAYDVFASGRTEPSNPGTPSMPMEGLPGWANSARYSIDAKSDKPQSAAMMRGPMMQALLEERFALQIHREQRDGPAYLMSLIKGQLKLHKAQEGTCVPFDFSEALNMQPSGQTFCGVPAISRRGSVTVLDAHGITLAGIAKLLHPDGRPVIDQTGIRGVFDIHLEWGSDGLAPSSAVNGQPPEAATAASPIDALREQLGLQLKAGRAVSELLVISHIEKLTEN
ncbi:MAG TPA: TIGR03435 family protein, partial [Bryobacteraceae bacterium]